MQDKLITSSHLSTDLEDLIQKADDLIRAAKAPSTRNAYQSDFRIFASCCTAHRLTSLPSAPQTVLSRDQPRPTLRVPAHSASGNASFSEAK